MSTTTATTTATTTTTAPPRRARRISHEVHRREVQVLRVHSPSPGFRAITFGADSLAGFVSAAFDDHVKFIFEDAAGEVQRRDYTPRRFDAARRELTLEFALHGEGPAAAWAAAAQPGDHAVIAGPRSSFVLPDDLAWQLLVGDSSALPAIARRLEELPAGARATVLLQVDAADRRALAHAARVDLQWLSSPDELRAAVRALQLPAPGPDDGAGNGGFAWCAGEAGLMRQVRQLLLAHHGLQPQALHAAAYWKQGAVAHHEPLGD